MKNEDSREEKLAILQVMQSVFAATMGVQSDRNRERDFRKGSARVFIVAGILGTILFIATIVTVVRLVLHAAG